MKYHSNFSGNFNPTNSRNIHDDTDTSLDRSGHSYVIFLITIPGIIIGVIVLFIAIACVRKQPIMNTSSAADLLKDPSNPTDGFLNNNSFTQHNVNFTGNEMKPSSSDWTNSSTIFASINNRALMNQSIYSQPLILNNNKAPMVQNNSLQNDGKISSAWNIANLRSLENRPNKGQLNMSNEVNTSSSLNLNAEDKMLMFDGNPGFLDNSNSAEMEPTWVEVTNKANQTPSHWVYNDMTSQDIGENAPTNIVSAINGTANIFENPFALSPFHVMAAPTSTGSYLIDYSLPKDISQKTGVISSVQSSPLIIKRLNENPSNSIYHQYSNRSLNQPTPPPYHSHHLSTVSPLHCKSQKSNLISQKSFNNRGRFVNIPPPTSAPPPLPQVTNMKSMGKKDILETLSSSRNGNSRKSTQPNISGSERYLSPYSPEFTAIVKTQMNESQKSDSMNELYSRPPSEHFYFKINDGKTEFI